MSFTHTGYSSHNKQDGREKLATYFRDNPYRDYADQRYYNVGIGRFMTPDPGGLSTANPKDPGSWNRYAYVQGDPVNYFDPLGLLVANPTYCPPEKTYDECYGPGDPFGGGGGGIGIGGGGGGGGPIGFRPVTKGERDAYEMAVQALLAAAWAAGASQEQVGQPYPKYLKVSSDSYRCWGKVVERDITYDLYDSANSRLNSGVITETLFPTDTTEPIITRPALNQSSSLPIGQFNDEISIQFGSARQYDQTFSVHSASAGVFGFAEVPLYVVGFGGEYGILHVTKTATYVDINGNRSTPIKCN